MNSKDRADLHQTNRAKNTPLSKELQNHIGSKLRAAYGQLVQEPVPERFSQLLKQLGDAEMAQRKAKPVVGGEEPNT